MDLSSPIIWWSLEFRISANSALDIWWIYSYSTTCIKELIASLSKSISSWPLYHHNGFLANDNRHFFFGGLELVLH